MSVKFEKETVRTAPIPGAKAGTEDTIHKIGEAVTGGKGQNGYLAVWVLSVQET
jgi:hypothetical protein